MKTWDRLSTFLEKGDLVVFAVAISVYHYFKALEPAGDPLYVAIPVALFIDLLHYRTIRRAVEQPGRLSALIALATTIMALGYHVVFYSLSVSGWHIWLYALPIPIGMAILAWHGAVNDPIDWKAESAALAAALESARSAAKEAESLRKEAEKRFHDAESAAKAEESARLALESKALGIEKRVKGLERVAAAFERGNAKTKAALMYSAGQFSDLEEAASWAGLSAPTISKHRKLVNGSQ